MIETLFDAAVCSPGCVNGGCTGPGTCSCYVGWTGSRCDRGDVHVAMYCTDFLKG